MHTARDVQCRDVVFLGRFILGTRDHRKFVRGHRKFVRTHIVSGRPITRYPIIPSSIIRSELDRQLHVTTVRNSQRYVILYLKTNFGSPLYIITSCMSPLQLIPICMLPLYIISSCMPPMCIIHRCMSPRYLIYNCMSPLYLILSCTYIARVHNPLLYAAMCISIAVCRLCT